MARISDPAKDIQCCALYKKFLPLAIFKHNTWLAAIFILSEWVSAQIGIYDFYPMDLWSYLMYQPAKNT